MSHKIDMRKLKTQKFLRDSLFTLMQQKKLSAITVNDICEEAMVHRTTFYKHFYDKYNLLEYMLEELLKDYLKVDIKERINRPFYVLNDIFSQNEQLKKILSVQQDEEAFHKVTTDYIVKNLQHDIKMNVHRIETKIEVPDKLIFYVYGSALNAFIQWRMEGTKDYSPDEIDEFFTQLLNIKVKDD